MWECVVDPLESSVVWAPYEGVSPNWTRLSTGMLVVQVIVAADVPTLVTTTSEITGVMAARDEEDATELALLAADVVLEEDAAEEEIDKEIFDDADVDELETTDESE